MEDVFHKIEKELPRLLLNESEWQSLYIDYHPPIVERLWRKWGEYRILLHKIYPCKAEDSLFHPHPWPSAIRVLTGSYEMLVGYGKGETIPPVATKMIFQDNFYYEMTDPDAWHSVRPIGSPTYSLMLTGKPWKRSSPKSDKPLHSLNEKQKEDLLDFFRMRYKKF